MRRKELDYARAIAIILIIVGHSIGLSFFWDKMIYSFHVPLFFIISGILLHYTNAESKTWKHFFRSKIKSIIIPSVLWELILSISYFFIKRIPVRELFMNTITLNFNLSLLWFIPCMLIAEILFLSFLKIMGKRSGIYHYIVALIIFIVAENILPVFYLKRVMVAAAFIAVGYITERMRKEHLHRADIPKYCELLALCVLWVYAVYFNVRVDLSALVLGNKILYFLHSICGSLLVIKVCEIIPENKVLSWMGRSTMGFLVTHVFVRHVVIAIEERMLGTFWGGWSLATIIIIVDIVVVALIDFLAPEIIGKKRRENKKV